MKITHPDRVLFPDVGVTKGDLAAYLDRVGDLLLRDAARRPLTLLRCPQGIDAECFFQKHPDAGAHEALGRVEIEEKSGKRGIYVFVEDRQGLRALAQLGVVEIHVWGSRVDDLQRPDRLVFDLDPDPTLPWSRVVGAARALRELLAEIGLDSRPRLTGGKGVHLVVPIEPALDWDQAGALTRSIATRLVEREPDLYTLDPLKAERVGKIFLDVLRNAFGATAIASYSPRARPGAPVAVPIRWDELGVGRRPDAYHLRNVLRRLASLRADPWEGSEPQRPPMELVERAPERS